MLIRKQVVPLIYLLLYSLPLNVKNIPCMYEFRMLTLSISQPVFLTIFLRPMLQTNNWPRTFPVPDIMIKLAFTYYHKITTNIAGVYRATDSQCMKYGDTYNHCSRDASLIKVILTYSMDSRIPLIKFKGVRACVKKLY